MDIVQPRLQDSSFNAEQNEQGRVTRKLYNGSVAAIADGDPVMIDVSVTLYGRGNAIKTTPAVADSFAVGIADEAIPAGEWGVVLRKGVKLNANVATGTAAELPLMVSGTAGRLGAGTIGTNRIVGFNLRLAAANLSDIYVDL
jgi:hypothetical protein